MRLRTFLISFPLAALLLSGAGMWMLGSSLIAVAPY